MRRSRVRDWLIGALAMLVLLVGLLAVGWWSVTSPPGSQGPVAEDDPGTGRAEQPPEPPPDLMEEEAWFADLDLSAGALVLPQSTLQDVQATGQGVRSSRDGLVADWLAVQATVPFEEVAAELGGQTVVSSTGDGQAVVERRVEVLGRDLTVVATGTVHVENGLLVVRPESIDLGGPATLSRMTAALVRGLVTIEHAIEGLPEGLVLLQVDVQDDGFRADLEGEDVVLVEGAGS